MQPLEDLQYSYDDSSDEEESWRYEHKISENIETLESEVLGHQKTLGKRKRKTPEHKEAERKLGKIVELRSDINVMEMFGRQEIYKHLPKYREKKRDAFGTVTFEHDVDVEGYNMQLLLHLEDNDIIDDAEECAEENVEFFTKENIHSLVRRLLRQTNSSTIDQVLKNRFQEVFSVSISEEHLGIVSQAIRNHLEVYSEVRPRLTLPTKKIPEVTSVEDFYVEELLSYRSLIRASRNEKKHGCDAVQMLNFDLTENLISQKTQHAKKVKVKYYKDYTAEVKGAKQAASTRFQHRRTVEELVLNL